MDLNTTLKEIVKDSIAPLLKSIGFKKNGLNFYKEIGDIIQCFNIQQSKWNTAESKSFTINIGLMHKSIFAQLSPREPSKVPKEYECQIRHRLSYLKSERVDWYTLSMTTSIPELVNEINNDLLDYAIPFFKKYEIIANWSDFTKLPNDFLIADLTVFLLLIELRKNEEAQNYIKSLYKDSLIPKTSTTTTIYPDQTSIIKESEPFVNWYHVNRIKELAHMHDIML